MGLYAQGWLYDCKGENWKELTNEVSYLPCCEGWTATENRREEEKVVFNNSFISLIHVINCLAETTSLGQLYSSCMLLLRIGS